MRIPLRLAVLGAGIACAGTLHAAAPVASDDSYTVQQGDLLTVAAPGVLGNDSDAESDPMTAVLVSDVGNGSLTLNADGSFSYRPDAAFYGSDSFSYEANDGTSSDLAVVALTVNQDYMYGGGGGGGGGYGSGAPSPAMLVLLALAALYPRGLKVPKRRAISP
jgi:VCBS repeat-containing protein